MVAEKDILGHVHLRVEVDVIKSLFVFDVIEVSELVLLELLVLFLVCFLLECPFLDRLQE